MARKAIYKHLTVVDTNAFPDDGTSPVGSNEWNEDPAPQGMYGNTPATSTITIASGVAIPTDSITVVTPEGGSGTDILDKLATTNTNEYDLIYLFGAPTKVVTLTHTASPSAAGHVSTVSGANETLSETVPTILMRKGTYWYGYGGGGSTTPTDITVADTTDTTCFPALFESATGDLAPKTDAGLAYNAGTGVLTATGFAGDITGDVTGDTSGSSGTCSGLAATATALATGRTISSTGEVTMTTGSFTGAANATGAATIADNIIDEANLKADNSPTNDYLLTAKSSAAGGLTWAAASGGGNHTEQGFDVYTTHTGTGTTADGIAYMFSRRIDANNDGLYIMLWKNGASTEVQIA